MDIFKLWMDFGMAWMAVLLALLLSVIYVLRFITKKENKGTLLLKRWNRHLRKHHKALGIVLIATGLLHGLFSTESVWSINIGTISWVASILLGVNWLIRKRLSAHKGWMYYHRLLTVLFLGLIIWHVIDVGGIQAPQVLFGAGPSAALTDTNRTASQSSTAEATPDATGTTISPSALPTSSYNGAQLKDGTYTGTATGYHPGLTVQVTIKNNKITSVEVVSHNEVNSRFYSQPMAIVPQEIIDAQSTDVDTVTSGTFTSIGIMNAVNDALRQALVSGTLPDDQALPANRGHGGH